MLSQSKKKINKIILLIKETKKSHIEKWKKVPIYILCISGWVCYQSVRTSRIKTSCFEGKMGEVYTLCQWENNKI